MIDLRRLLPCQPRVHIRAISLLVALAAGFALTGCDRLSPLLENKDHSRDQAEQKQASGDYLGAVSSYEKSLDGTSKTADAHFRMGLIYDEKLNDSLSAVYHFRRYLALQPSGSHARDAKNNLARLELTLATSLSGGTLISHAEALRLKNENTDLRKQLALHNNGLVFTPVVPAGRTPGPDASAAKTGGEPARANQKVIDKKLAPGSRTYQVQPGDTLASISRKFYKSRERAKDIQDANLNAVPDAAKLKPGQTIIIP